MTSQRIDEAERSSWDTVLDTVSSILDKILNIGRSRNNSTAENSLNSAVSRTETDGVKSDLETNGSRSSSANGGGSSTDDVMRKPIEA